MSAGKHSGGRWSVGTTYATHDHPTRFWRTYVGNGEAVAQTFGATQAEAEANASLIAAAPQQHDALLAVSLAPGFDALDDATKNAVRAALAAATGEQA